MDRLFMVKQNFYWKLHYRIKIHDTTVLSVLKLFKVIESFVTIHSTVFTENLNCLILAWSWH